MKSACLCSQSPCNCAAQHDSRTQSNWNRPGLSSLRYRYARHAGLLANMRARLATMQINIKQDDGSSSAYHPLQGLSTRALSDPSIALLDGWASIGDVLGFYQERIANEGFLRTARERRSILEMARLVGYELKPGVAASVFLAYTLDKSQLESVLLPVGTRAQSVPGPGEVAQNFETSEETKLRWDWNNLRPRSDAPQNIQLAKVLSLSQLYVAGTSSNLKPGERIFLRFDDSAEMGVLRTVSKIEAQASANRTQIQLQALPELLQILAILAFPILQAAWPFAQKQKNPDEWKKLSYETQSLSSTVVRVMQQAWLGNLSLLQRVLSNVEKDIANPQPLVSQPGGSSSLLNNNINAVPKFSNFFDAYMPTRSNLDSGLSNALDAFEAATVLAVKAWSAQDDAGAVTDPSQFVNQLLEANVPQARNKQQLARSLGTSFVRGADNHPQMLFHFAPRLRQHFYNAWRNAELAHSNPQLKAVYAMRANLALFGANTARPAAYDVNNKILPQKDWPDWTIDYNEAKDSAFLDGAHEAILAQGYAVISMLGGQRRALKIKQADTIQRSAYGISGKTTRLQFEQEWWNGNQDNMSDLRATLVLAQSDELNLANAPITEVVKGNEIVLDALYNELESGRWIILSGERADIPGVTGVKVAELLMISGLRQDYNPNLAGDSIHTRLLLATSTAYEYKRDSITIYGNVVKATHGETRIETLGSGDGAASWQSFALKQAPLTFVAANNPRGVDSTLKVLVDQIEWHESASLLGSGPQARQFISKTSDDGKTSVQFGNGQDGARLPTGVENIQAVYRQGLGEAGNVRAGQINMLISRPLGVREVINPLPASGGAERESRDQARANLPLAVMALDRLVALDDYANFTRNFAGIGKAQVSRISDGKQQLIHLSIAGANDAPIDTSSDLYLNLLAALRSYGDPDLPLRVQVRELVLLIVNARIKLLPDYQWEVVEAAARQNLLQAFSFERRALGQAALLCEVIALLQNVAGVAYVDVDHFGGVPEKKAQPDGSRRLLDLDELATRVAQINHSNDDDFDEAPLSNAVLANAAGLENGGLRPAQLLLFTSQIADTIILNQIK